MAERIRGWIGPWGSCIRRALRATTLLGVVLLGTSGMLTVGVTGAAQLGTCQIQVIPPHPTPHDSIVLLLSGIWKDSCVPQAPQVSIVGNHITIATSNPGRACLMVPTPWQLTVPIGRLPGGVYVVTVTYSGPGTLPQTIGRATFAVEEPLPPLPPAPVPLPPISGTTDAEGKFTVPLPWPGTTAAGRLLGPDGQPLAYLSFVLTPVPRGPTVASPADIAGFTFHAPGYAKTTVTRFSLMFSPFGTSFLLGDVQLSPAELPWSANRPLTWDDFQGDPPEGAEDRDEAAEIVMWLGYSFQTRTWFDRATRKWKAHLTSVTTTNTMDRSKSWVVPNQRTPDLLNHEQKHFDLNEVYRGLLDAALQKLVCNLEATGDTKEEAEKNLDKKLKETFDKVKKKCDEVQEQYDKETDHGRNADKQKEWDKKIGDWLADPSKAPQP